MNSVIILYTQVEIVLHIRRVSSEMFDVFDALWTTSFVFASPYTTFVYRRVANICHIHEQNLNCLMSSLFRESKHRISKRPPVFF